MQRHTILNRFFLPLVALAICGNCFAVARRATVSNATRTDSITTKQQKTSNRGRSATPSNATAPKTANRGRAATVSSSKPVVSARAGVKQNVVGGGTKIASTTKSNIVSESCAQKYNGCMDAFCMLDNDTGGRCICSNKIFEIDKILAEIEEIDSQSYQLATIGVEAIESGVDITAVTATKKEKNNVLGLWENKTNSENRGNKLYASSHELCVEKIPECESAIKMLELTYSQQVKADCVAYENSVVQKKKTVKRKIKPSKRNVASGGVNGNKKF